MNGIGSVSGNSNLYGGYENYPKPFFPGEKEKPDIDLPGIKKEEDPGKIKIKGEGDGPGGECETCKRRKYIMKDGKKVYNTYYSKNVKYSNLLNTEIVVGLYTIEKDFINKYYLNKNGLTYEEK